jgi:hypothetical protein
MPAASEAMLRYRILEEDLRLVRSENRPGSLLEDPILEEMAHLWWQLSDIERAKLDDEGPTCWPEGVAQDENLPLLTDRDTLSGDMSGPVRTRTTG